MKVSSFLYLIAISLCSSSLLAHPGHGKPGNSHSIEHYTTEPVHLLEWSGLVVIVLIIAYAGWKLSKSSKK